MANFLLACPLFFLLLLSYFIVINAQTINGSISVGSSLTAGDNAAPWLSPSEDFAFGFHQLEDNDNSFLLAIWYYKLPHNITTVWYANIDNPAVPRNSKLVLSADQGLVLTDPHGSQQWSSGQTGTSAVDHAVMNDTGNFVLLDGNSNPVWESFKHPTDTLLPTQFMEIGGLLSSRKSQTNFSQGRFQFRLDKDGSAVLNPFNLHANDTYDTYYNSPTADVSNSSNSGYQVIFDASGRLYVLRRNGNRFDLIQPRDRVSASNFYQRVSLNSDGVLTSSIHSKDPSAANQSWESVQSIPDDICRLNIQGPGTGPCGYNSICRIQDGRPNCKCPESDLYYSLVDPSDPYSGCKPNFLVGCDSNTSVRQRNEQYFIQEIPSTDWPQSDYDIFSPSNIESCKSSCLNDCLCAAAIFGKGICWKKKLPLSNGRDKQFGTTALLKLRVINNSSPQSPYNLPPINVEDQDKLVIVMSALLGSSVFVNFIFVVAICIGFFFYFKRNLVGTLPDDSSVQSNLRSFTYKELTEATNGFEEELGRGSCGVVYKGETKSAGLIAVKKLDRMLEDNNKEFKTEVGVIGQTHHKNLVRLVGYCEEKQHRLLVYEYLRNGTLSSFLFGDLKPSWKQRTQIAFGIARGLVYLHEECSTQIIHCDIKPQNILLDEYYNARISDFGLSKLLFINQSHTKTNIRGTKGYVAPDWFRAAPVSVKVDVYSFGVVLLEIICCRRNVDMQVDEVEKRILTDWVCDCYLDGKLDALVENDMEAINEVKMIERFVMVAIWCLQEDPNIRPTMKKVMLMLEGIVQVAAPPSPFSFTSIN